MSGSQYMLSVDYGTATPVCKNLTTTIGSPVNCNLKILGLAQDAFQCWAFLTCVLTIVFFLDIILFRVPSQWYKKFRRHTICRPRPIPILSFPLSHPRQVSFLYIPYITGTFGWASVGTQQPVSVSETPKLNFDVVFQIYISMCVVGVCKSLWLCCE